MRLEQRRDARRDRRITHREYVRRVDRVTAKIEAARAVIAEQLRPAITEAITAMDEYLEVYG